MGSAPVRSSHPPAIPNVPRPLTSFVGRDAELRALRALLTESRLVTITGTGGAGKTRLAAELTRTGTSKWPDGAWWVELAGVDEVPGAVIRALELPGLGPAVDVVTSWLAARKTLIVLDNCEHVIADAALFCQVALERCPHLTILATSRERLGVPGEARWPLTPLDEPDAMRLFEARARLVRPEFSTKPHADTVVRICARLDRLPLAIEMAAARLDMMSEREVLENLNDRFRVLATGARTVPERQQTMNAAIDWSYRLLSEEEAHLFRRLAVFHGGFSMEAAQAVWAIDRPASLLLLMSALVQKSMVVADRLNDDRTRYRLLETHHDFATEKLRESGELELVQQLHHRHFSSQHWEPLESANFWHAVNWARENSADGGLALALEIGDSDFSDQIRAKTLILDLLGHAQTDESLRTKAMTMAARLAWRQADHGGARELADSAVSLARKVGDTELIARALNGAGLIHETSGQLELAGQMYDEALSLLRDSTNRLLVDDVSNARGLLAIAQGNPAGALEILTSSVEAARSQGDQPRHARYLESLANAQLDLDDVDGAAESWSESLYVFRVVNDWFGIIWAMGGLSLVAATRHQDERALRLAAAADRLAREYSLTAWSLRVNQLAAACDQARARLGNKSKGDTAWKEGQTMTTEEAIEYGLSGNRPAEQAPVEQGLLSRRELEVVAMVAAGMTNKQIAQRLFIAERTAEGHVERIRNKLGVRSRTEVATWAVAHGLSKQPLDKPPPTSKV